MGDRDIGLKRTPQGNRAHRNHNRLYQHLGVRDLREIIDRKRRSEEGYVNEVGVPPPDPSYNYLKDPLREGHDSPSSSESSKQPTNRKHHKNFNSTFRKEPSSRFKSNRDIETPPNIKVEFSTSTGEHVYKFDESTLLPTIKHVPDHQTRVFRGRNRGRGPRNFQNRPPNSAIAKHVTAEQPIDVVVPEENWDEAKNRQEHNNEVFEETLENAQDLDLTKQVENLTIKQSDETEKHE